MGPMPTPKFRAAWNVASPLPRSTETVLEEELVTARSSLPSLLKSSTAKALGRGVPSATISAVRKVPSPLPSSNETLLLPKLATARSGTPSPLKSPTTGEIGLTPLGKVRAGWKVPSPLPRSTETAPENQLATATSRTLTPLKSPRATEIARLPAAKSPGANETVWAGAGVGNIDANANPVATSRQNLTEVPGMACPPRFRGVLVQWRPRSW